jgi:hypothetical protein
VLQAHFPELNVSEVSKPFEVDLTIKSEFSYAIVSVRFPNINIAIVICKASSGNHEIQPTVFA